MTDIPGIIITYPFPLGYFNGGTRSVREISKNFGRRGIPVYIITVSTKFNSHFPRPEADEEHLGYQFDAQLAADCVRIIRVRPNIFHPFLDGWRVRRALKGLLAEKPIAAVLSFYSEAIFLPGFLKARGISFNIFAIWQSYEAAFRLPSKIRKPFKFLDTAIRRHLIRRSYQQANHLFAISDHIRQELVVHVGVAPERVTTTYLGVSPEFSKVPRPKPARIRRFVFFGRVVRTKGIADAIQALTRLKAQGYDDWEYHINGEGHLEWARSLIAKAGLEQQIYIHKPSNDKALFQFLSEAHLVLMPSHTESFGLSFAEAQAAGLPVIGYAAGSVPEVVADGETGWLAPTGNIEQLTALLVKAIENPEQSYRMGLVGRERVKELFTWEKTADIILNGIRQTGANPGLV